MTAQFAEVSFIGVGTLTPASQHLSYLRPSADNIDGSWTNEADGTNLFASIDEPPPPNDSDYIKSVGVGTDTAKIQLSAPPSGAVGEPFKVRYRYRRSGSGNINLIVTLYEGNTAIASWTHNNVGGSFLTAEQVLTAPQFASIGNFSNLYIGLVAQIATFVARQAGLFTPIGIMEMNESRIAQAPVAGTVEMNET